MSLSSQHADKWQRAIAAGVVMLFTWLVAFAYFKLRPDLLLRGSYFVYSDGGQYLWVVDQLDRGRRLYAEVHWYYGIIPLWCYRAWAACLGNSAATYCLCTFTVMAANAGLACWWLSRLMSLRWAVGGVVLTLMPWLIRNSVANIHVPWEVTSLLLLACAWQPLAVRTASRQILLGALLVMMVMIKVPLMLAGGFALFATDVVNAWGPGTPKLSLAAFVRRYWISVVTAVIGLALYLGWIRWMAGDAGVWFDTAFPLYMTTAYAAIGDPPPWHWQGVPFLLFNQLPQILALAGAAISVIWVLARKQSHTERWVAQGGLILSLAFLCGPLSVIRQAVHVGQYYWLGSVGLAVCLPLFSSRVRWAFVAVLLLVASAVPYKLILQPKVAELRPLENGQQLWLTEAEWSQWNALMKGWKTHRTEAKPSVLVFEIGAGSYFYGQIPQPFRHYYYYPGFLRPYDIDWLMAHQGEFCGVLLTANSSRLDRMQQHITQREWLHQAPGSTDDRLKLGEPDRISERCLFLKLLPAGK